MIEAGADWDEAARRLYSFGNGAAMRVAPIGHRYFWDRSQAV
jgi:ADP-ribosylglycohydrolase